MVKSNKTKAATILGLALKELREFKHEENSAVSALITGLIRGYITSFGVFTTYGAVYQRLSSLELAVRHPVRRCLP